MARLRRDPRPCNDTKWRCAHRNVRRGCVAYRTKNVMAAMVSGGLR